MAVILLGETGKPQTAAGSSAVASVFQECGVEY